MSDPAKQPSNDPTGSQISGSAKVVIACKLPSGLKLEVGRLGEDDYETYTINGSNSTKALLDDTGFALTTIPAAFWDKWLNYSPKLIDANGREVKVATLPNKRREFIINGLVYAHASRDHVQAHAVEHAGARTGMEPLVPKVDMPKDAKGKPLLTEFTAD